MASVAVDRLVKVFAGGVRALDEVTLNVADKEFMALLGPSGCGKTTLLRIIAGLETPTSGTVSIGDEIVNHVPPKDRDIAMVFQNYALYPHWKVRDNVTLGLRTRRTPKAIVQQRLTEVSSLLDIAGLLDRMPRQLSGGQQQRVALGRAIVRQPRAFLMDEPLSNLDARLRLEMRTQLVKLHRRLETTMIYVTHDQGEALTMATRVAVMREGVVQQVDAPLNVYRHPANRFVAGFLGSPEMSFLHATVRREEGGFHVSGPSFNVRLPAVRDAALAGYLGRTLIIGIRPEELALEPAGDNRGRMPALIDVVEPLGGRSLVYALVGSAPIVAEVRSDTKPVPGEIVEFTFDTSRVHAFDEATEVALW